MKRIIKLIVMLCVLFASYRVNALFSASCIDEWKDKVAYCWGNIVTDTWAYDTTTNMYVLVDSNGYKVREVKDLNEDSLAVKGKLELIANIPNNMINTKIYIDVGSNLYNYSFVLDKSNNFAISEEINADNYKVSYYMVEGYPDDDTMPMEFNVFENNTTTLKLDYSKYDIKEENNKKKKNGAIIIYIVIGIFLLGLIGIIFMILQAQNM